MMASIISGTLALPLLGPLDVRVALEDITMQDRAARTLAETVICAAEHQARFSLVVPNDLPLHGRAYTLSARATRGGGAVTVAGTIALHPWQPDLARPHHVVLESFPIDGENG